MGPSGWQQAVLVQRRPETPTAATLVLDVPQWQGHLAGQHVDVRLTAEDGYTAQRSYSIASPPRPGPLELTVERLEDGEVSGYLVDDLPVGAPVEMRGPIGGHFVWQPGQTAPLTLIGGGSGVVPLMAMLRHRALAAASGTAVPPAVLVLSARTAADVFYAPELPGLADATTRIEVTLTRESPVGWPGRTGRVTAGLLAEVVPPPDAASDVFVCGPNGFVEAVATALVDAGHDPALVRTERFGPTGT